MTVRILQGDCRDLLPTLDAGSMQTVVTSPPYYALRDYGVEGQIGLEGSVDEYVDTLVGVFREVKRVLKDDGTLWLNLGDSYAANKQMVGAPWRVAFALQADGWCLRSDIIWSKPNPMPESVTDRPTKAHEYIFLLSKQPRYYYDADAIRTPVTAKTLSTYGSQRQLNGDDTGLVKANNLAMSMPERRPRCPYPGSWATEGDHSAIAHNKPDKQRGHSRRHAGFNDRWDGMSRAEQQANGANARTVWEIATHPYPGAHFATFPPELARRCILAGSRPGDTVGDPFSGSGTVGMVSDRLQRHAVLIDINPVYVDMGKRRIVEDAPLFAEVVR